MKLSESFNALMKHDHTTSFDELGSWLDQTSKSPKPMKNLYKIAASFIIGTLVLLACTVPVQQEEEIGYMIKGMAVESAETGKTKIAGLSNINLTELQFTPVLHEIIQEDGTPPSQPEKLTEVVLVLPEANYEAALAKKQALEGTLNFRSLEIMPIEETVERTFFETALDKTFNIKVDRKFSEEEVEVRINRFLHENSAVVDEAEIELDENGNRHAVFRIRIDNDSGTYELKRDLDGLYRDLSPENNLFFPEGTSPEELELLKKAEIQKMNENHEQQNDQQF
jgi:hypothetical protein